MLPTYSVILYTEFIPAMHSGSSGTGEAIHYLDVLVGSGVAEVEVAQVARIFLLPFQVFVPS